MTEYTDADLITAYADLETQREQLVERQRAEIQPLVDGIAVIKGEMLARLQQRGAKNTKVDGVGTAYTQDILSVKVDNPDAFLAWIRDNPSNRLRFLDVGVLKKPVQEWFELVDTNGQPVNTEPPPGLAAEWFTKCNIRRS